MVKSGDVLLASPSNVGPASIGVPALPRGTKSLVLALTRDKGSFALRSRGRSSFQGDCTPGFANAVRAPLDLVDVGDLSWQVGPGVAWQSWVWSSPAEK